MCVCVYFTESCIYYGKRSSELKPHWPTPNAFCDSSDVLNLIASLNLSGLVPLGVLNVNSDGT